ncbi:formylglycine-generating enzyme family protein [Nostoc sp. WHI]|uniref:formylglycine-generating enzyme family protein n=1 Tax=Nostoc sp. WHI TaxID=2650611 RepID=UPI0018C6554B|nr:formylglycine-generating enzyme family protein [Nostoc sp. WHI]MBG1267102.1 formylglycine-generating enzyme family protein [Nostoc sp. WHI]
MESGNLKLTVVQLDLVKSSESSDAIEREIGVKGTRILIKLIQEFVENALDSVINPPDHDLIISLGGDGYRILFEKSKNAYEFVKSFRKIVENYNKNPNNKKREFRIAATTGEVDFDKSEPCANKIIGHYVLAPLSRLVTAPSGWFYVDELTFNILPDDVKQYFTEKLVKAKDHEKDIPAWHCKIIFDEQDLQTQKFESVTVNAHGQVTNRKQNKASYFKEYLGEVTGEPSAPFIEMVKIPGGTFKMGSPPDELERYDFENPQHPVNVEPFFLAKYPVTQEQWQFVAQLPQVNRELDKDPSRFKGVNRPVERVSWYDAIEFCLRLSQHTGRIYSLPSEAQWEYACRAGTTTPFHFGQTITSELANYDANQVYGAGVKGTYRKEITPVGSFKVANAFGLYDMHGNVWEWCLDDSHNNYKGAPTDGSPWFDDNDNFSQKEGRAVLRGGSWIYVPKLCRSASRSHDTGAERGVIFSVIGFRVVCAVGRIL